MDMLIIIMEYIVTLLIAFVFALMLLSIVKNATEPEIKKDNHWLLKIEEVETKQGITYLIYNILNNQFLYQVSNMDDLMPWLVEQLEKNTGRTISVMHDDGTSVAIELKK